MSLLYFGLDVFCLFEAGVSDFDTQSHPRTNVEVYTVHCTLYTSSNTGALAHRVHVHRVMALSVF
jgi:hypothetical protein